MLVNGGVSSRRLIHHILQGNEEDKWTIPQLLHGWLNPLHECNSGVQMMWALDTQLNAACLMQMTASVEVQLYSRHAEIHSCIPLQQPVIGGGPWLAECALTSWVWHAVQATAPQKKRDMQIQTRGGY